MKIRNLGIITTITGVLAGGGCRSVARDEARLAREILNYHSQEHVLEQCQAVPYTFYFSQPRPSINSTENEVRGCTQLAVDKIAAQEAGDKVVDLAEFDKKNGKYPRPSKEVSAIMQSEFDDALLNLRRSKPIPFSKWDNFPESIQSLEDGKIVGYMSEYVYMGKPVSDTIDEFMFLSEKLTDGEI